MVLPTKVPNLLLNGSSGIAVGMATNIPPHNLSDLSDALLMLIDDPESSVEDLMDVVQGPDFPTGGYVYAGQGQMCIRDSSYPVIGRMFGGKDHSTVMHGVKKIKLLQESDRLAHSMVTELTKACLEHRG